MALEAKKKLCKGETETLEILTAATVLSFWKIVTTYFVNNSLIRRERYIYLIYIFKLQSFEIYMGVGVCVRVCVYIYIIDR